MTKRFQGQRSQALPDTPGGPDEQGYDVSKASEAKPCLTEIEDMDSAVAQGFQGQRSQALPDAMYKAYRSFGIMFPRPAKPSPA